MLGDDFDHGLSESISPQRVTGQSQTIFAPVTKFFADSIDPVFSDASYYKQALGGGSAEKNAIAQQLHGTLVKYLSSKDIRERNLLAQKLTAVYWEFLKCMMPEALLNSLSKQKRMLLRFAVVLPALLTDAQKKLFSSVIMENTTGEPIYYLDEWLEEIAAGRLELSVVNDAKVGEQKSAENAGESFMRLKHQQNNAHIKLQTIRGDLERTMQGRNRAETELKQLVESFIIHEPVRSLQFCTESLTEGQKHLPVAISNQLKILLQLDTEITGHLHQYRLASMSSHSLEEKINSNSEDSGILVQNMDEEINTVFEMMEQTVGSKENPFPIFTSEFYHCEPRTTGFRENVIDMLAKIEAVDLGVFCRIHKNVSNRIVPHVLLLPSYGNTGFCWEPFRRPNVITSPGRIVIPMYPKNLQTAILNAVADLRWQTAKEKASFHWMSEGLTGNYYEWFSRQKLKMDIKEHFIDSYIIWITKESNGIPQLDSKLREIFWRQIPFSKPVVERLKSRNAVYQELSQRDGS
ncbi:MAG: hypothetical protein LBS97_05260 [Treponema sp.]|nr:hypothetical protein [Treponema sp.]